MAGRGPEMWRMSQCCGGASGDIVQVDVFGDGRTVGLVGLTDVFDELYRLGHTPDESLQDELVKRVAARNYIPSSAKARYGAALLREYALFVARKASSGDMP